MTMNVTTEEILTVLDDVMGYSEPCDHELDACCCNCQARKIVAGYKANELVVDGKPINKKKSKRELLTKAG